MQHNSSFSMSESSETFQNIYVHIKECPMRSKIKPMNQTLRKSIYGRSHMQMGTPRFLL